MRQLRDRPHRIPRRRFLELGAAVFVAGGVAAAAFRTGGYALPAERRLEALSAWQFVVLQSAARRIAASDRPDDASIPDADEVDVAGFIDAWVARADERVRRDLGRFLAYIEHVAPLGVGSPFRFTRLSPSVQDKVLASVEASYSGVLRAGFEGLKSLVFMGYYRDVRTWSIVGYDGPLVGRPAGGWW